MASTGDILCGTGEQVTRPPGGFNNWTVPSRITAIDGVYTDTSDSSGSHYLVGRNFSFTGLSGATILGVTMKILSAESNTGSENFFAQLQNDSAALIGSSKSVVVNTNTPIVYTYGGIADLWGATLTEAIVTHANFGVRMWFQTAHILRVDYCTMALEYTPGGGQGPGHGHGGGSGGGKGRKGKEGLHNRPMELGMEGLIVDRVQVGENRWRIERKGQLYLASRPSIKRAA